MDENIIIIPIGTRQMYLPKDYTQNFIFNWRQITENLVTVEQDSFLYDWLYAIKFNVSSAFVLEMIQCNIHQVIINREKTFFQIVSNMQINIAFFQDSLEKIKKLLIEYKRVKICSDGKVIMMNGEG